MYGKNLTFKTGGVDACRCGEILGLIADGQLDTEPLITHTYPLSDVMEAYRMFEARGGRCAQGGGAALSRPPDRRYEKIPCAAAQGISSCHIPITQRG